jgi:hypothetical protein
LLASGKKKIFQKQQIVSTAVENLTHHPKVKGSTPAANIGSGKRENAPKAADFYHHNRG